MSPMKQPAVHEVRLALPEGSRQGVWHGRDLLRRRSSLRTWRLERPSNTASVLGTVLLVAVPLLIVAGLLISIPSGVASRHAAERRDVISPYRVPTHAFGLSPSTGRHGSAQVRQIEHLLGRKVDIVNFYAGWPEPGFQSKALDVIEALGALPEVTWEPSDYRLGTNQPPLHVVAHHRRRFRWLHTIVGQGHEGMG